MLPENQYPEDSEKFYFVRVCITYESTESSPLSNLVLIARNKRFIPARRYLVEGSLRVQSRCIFPA